MISVDFATHRFQLRAAAVVVNGEFILLHRPEGDRVWALPGGRVAPGETAQETIVREFAEELGAAVECASLLYVVENFFAAGDRACHEIGLYFQATVQKGPLLDTSHSHAGIEGDTPLEFKWFHKTALNDIDLRPAGLAKALRRTTLSFEHIVQKD